MSIEVKMPALSPTMEKGSIAKWLVSVGDRITAGHLIAEVETDKATMEIESTDEGTIVAILIPEGTEDVPVGTPIAIVGAAEDVTSSPVLEEIRADVSATPTPVAPAPVEIVPAQPAVSSEQIKIPGDPTRVSPLARRLAAARGIDLGIIKGSGANGRIVKADLGLPSFQSSAVSPAPSFAAGIASIQFDLTAQRDIPHDEIKLSSMRKTIARRLTESKQQIPHIYLSVDVRLDALLALRGEVNTMLARRGIKVSVNDMVVKALALALKEVPSCNVTFTGDTLIQYHRADISVAVSIPGGLITPVVKGAESKALSAIAEETRELAVRAREGKLQPSEYQGGTASISNMGMMNIRQFDAVINPPQAMILAVGAAEKRGIVVDDAIAIATMMTITGSFDHRAVDGADGAALMNAVRRLIEQPMGLLA